MPLDGETLAQAVKATFERRKTEVSIERHYVFSDEFKQDKDKQAQWNAFLNKNNLDNKIDFSDFIDEVKMLLSPVYKSIVNQRSFKKLWSADEFEWKEYPMSEYQFVEKPLLTQLASMNWQVYEQGAGIPGGPTQNLRPSFWEVLLKDEFNTGPYPHPHQHHK